MRECCSKVCPIDGGMPGVPGEVYILALGAEQLHSVPLRCICEAYWEHSLTIAVNAGAPPKLCIAELFEHELLTVGCGDEPCVDESVEHLCVALNDLLLLVSKLLVALAVQNHVQSEFIVGNGLGKTVKVELILDKVFVYFDKKFVSSI